MLQHCEKAPNDFADYARTLFAAMQTGGVVGFERVEWFNGGLFDNDFALPLEKQDVADLLLAARLDWSEIDPSILGTLFERGLDPDKRSQLGAHYTDRDKIMMIVNPIIVDPLLAEWAEVKTRIETALRKAQGAGNRAARTRAEKEAERLHSAFIERLKGFRVLDPACGSGNFLYLSLLALKDIEHRVNLEAEALGLPRGFPTIGPECVKGIELNPYAAAEGQAKQIKSSKSKGQKAVGAAFYQKMIADSDYDNEHCENWALLFSGGGGNGGSGWHEAGAARAIRHPASGATVHSALPAVRTASCLEFAWLLHRAARCE